MSKANKTKMEAKNIEFIKKFYANNTVCRLLFEQAKNYLHCIGAGKSLIEKGWTFPIMEVPIEQLDVLINNNLDIFFPIRCVGDRDMFIIWDIEYFNKEDSKFIFDRVNQRKIFEWLAPSLELVEEILITYGIKYQIDITMSGIHVWSKIPTDSKVFAEFAEEGFVHQTLAEKYSKVVTSDRKRAMAVSENLGRAYNTAGKLLEFFTHKMITLNKLRNPFKIPVTISDTPQLSEPYPHSGVSSDITQYGHPIYMRCIRAFCSTHQKSLLNGFENLGPAIDIVKIDGLTYDDAIDIMWDVDKASTFYEDNFAGRDIVVEPSEEGWRNGLSDYKKSALRQVHKEWENTLPSQSINLNELPDLSCHLNESAANPALLTPSNLQAIAEYSGRESAAVIKKVFKTIADFYSNNALGWYDHDRFTGIDWNKYDAITAADFWGRVYWSLKKMGLGRGR